MKESVRKLFIIYIAVMLTAHIFFPKNALCITIREEEELSREFMKVVFKHLKLIKDPPITDYVNNVGQKIVSSLPAQPFKYHFYVIKEDNYNAFATPAGHIFIYSGLFEDMETEEELAGILAHEIAHVVCRHVSQKIERSSKIGLATLAGIAAGIFLGIGGAGAAANAVSVGTVAAGQSLSLAYSRDDERQADQLGLKYLARTGYSAAGLLTVLKKIRNKQWFGSDVIPTYLMTHPAVEERIGYISGNLKLETGNSKLEIRNSAFRRAHTRLVAVYGNRNKALERFEVGVRKYPRDPLARYGYGLILERTGNRKDAIVHFKKALEKRMFDPYILKDLGRAYLLDGNYPEALKALEGSVSIEPFNAEGLFFLGRTQMELNTFEKAASTFETLVEKHPDYKQAFYFLGEAYGKQGKLKEAHYYLGIYYKNAEKWKNAEFHLKKSLNLTSDPDKKLELEEMLREIRKYRVREKKRTPSKHF
ncbi:M48 family metallopeptidase [Desulfonema magnum]|uniref:Peptidase M48 domain- and tetratricopeptide repeat-containing protein n=1 Tax=Desulfonema magnum TaxID=45655 RepID=A0A975GTM1_9BACT|nr:M48 family metallopeptidase [Desulfonema magnum]QTA93255.1 Peptidase M48 domain- and tetratricopeptide repeat-containing protein [Desulfonema magnum]